jgi:hypothetical protein
MPSNMSASTPGLDGFRPALVLQEKLDEPSLANGIGPGRRIAFQQG